METLNQDRLDGLTTRLPVDGVPVPDNATDCGLFVAVVLIVSAAVRRPVAVGLKRIVIEQLADGPRAEPHVLAEIKKSVEFEPPTKTLFIVIDEALLFVNVADLGPPVLPNATPAHESVEGLTVAAAT